MKIMSRHYEQLKHRTPIGYIERREGYIPMNTSHAYTQDPVSQPASHPVDYK